MDRLHDTLNHELLAAMDERAGEVCFRIPRYGRYVDVTYRRFRERCLRLARFLRERGAADGERVVLLAPNSLEWMAGYAAASLAGGVAVPISATLPPAVIRFVLRDADPALVIAREDLAGLAAEELGDAVTVVVAAAPENELAFPHVALPEVLAERLSSEAEETLVQQAERVPGDAPAAILYTAGATGQPKGALFTQEQRLQAMRNLEAWLEFADDDDVFTVLPWAYPPSLDFSLSSFLRGVPNSLARDPRSVLQDLRQASPTVILAVPVALQRLSEQVLSFMRQLPKSGQEVFRWALAVGSQVRAAGEQASRELREQYARADLTFFSRIRGDLGGRLRRVYTTGAPLPQALAELAETIGLVALDCYSVTEAGGFPGASRPRERRARSCGRAAPGFELRIAASGEVTVRGASVMRAYWRRPDETRERLDADGWLATGDFGELDGDGFLRFTGRKQPVMLLSTGGKVAPSAIERELTASPFIVQADVFGEGRPYVTALLVPDLAAIAERLGQEDAEALKTNSPEATSDLRWYWSVATDSDDHLSTTAPPEVKAVFDEVVADVNSRLDAAARLQRYVLIDQRSGETARELARLKAEADDLVARRCCRLIESMYPEPVASEPRIVSQVEVDPERLRELMEKENILDAWMADAGVEFLLELARAKQIDGPSIVHICDTAASIAQMENEEKPLSTVLIVGDPARIARVLPASEIQLLRYDHIRRMRKSIITLAAMVDGVAQGFVVDKHGYVHAIRKLQVAPNESSNPFFGPLFRLHATISRQCQAMVFLVPSGGRQVRVFADGNLVGRYANGDWFPDTLSRMDEVMDELTRVEQYRPQLLERVLRCAFRMSEQNLGALFVVGDADEVLKRSDASSLATYAWIARVDLDKLSDAEVINFARQDGATVIDSEGRLRGCNVLLRPDAGTSAEVRPGSGGRHTSAAKMSAEADCLAITVSQDGPITIYDGGRRLVSL